MIDDACAAPRGSDQPSIQVLVPATSKESKYPSKSEAPALSTVVSGPMSKEKTEAHTQNEDDDALAPLKYQLEKVLSAHSNVLVVTCSHMSSTEDYSQCSLGQLEDV